MALQVLAFAVRNVLDWCDLSLPKHFCNLIRYINYNRLKLTGSYILQEELFGDDIGCVVTWVQLAGKLKSDEVIIYLHGGGFTLRDGGDLIFSDSILSNWSKCSDKAAPVVCGIQYALADEGSSSYPTAIHQIIRVQEVLASRGYKIIGISGDSAGGNLAITSLLKRQEVARVSGHAPACFVGISPACDFHMQSDAFTRNKYKDLLSFTWMNRCRRAYICGKPPLGENASDEEKHHWLTAIKDPFVSPLFASDGQLAGLPPMLVYGGSDEALIDDIRAFVRRFAALSAPSMEFIEGGPGTMHIYPFLMAPGRQRENLYKHIINFILKHGCARIAGNSNVSA
mgnify:FL=1